MKKTVFLFFAFFCLAFSSQAQFSVGGQFGPVFPVGPFSRSIKAGFELGALAKFHVSEKVLAGAEFDWYRFSTGFEGYTNNYTTFVASLEYLFDNIEQLTPYIGVNGGLFRFAPRVQNLPVAENEIVTSFGAAPVVGAYYALQENLDLNVNLKLNIAFADQGQNMFIPLNIGLLYKFE